MIESIMNQKVNLRPERELDSFNCVTKTVLKLRKMDENLISWFLVLVIWFQIISNLNG